MYLAPRILSKLPNSLFIGLKLFMCDRNVTSQALNLGYKTLKVLIVIVTSLFLYCFGQEHPIGLIKSLFRLFWSPLGSHLARNILTINWL